MSLRRLIRSPRARRGIAASAIVLSLGGLVLARTPAGAHGGYIIEPSEMTNGTTFHGPGVSGSFALSHSRVMADARQRVFAELRLRADASEWAASRAPVAMTIVLDTSGSMQGDKLAEAKRSAQRLLSSMDPDDEVAFVRYDSQAEVIQPMARVAEVRQWLSRRIDELRADGGTNIPAALSQGIATLQGASHDRVRRLVLVSDGLDSTRSEAERLAAEAREKGATVSALGIGLDFDEGYMASVARIGHGNFGFVENAAALATFLDRELRETGATTVFGATAEIQLPGGVRFRRALGAEARVEGSQLSLSIGSLYAGDERRVVIELETDVRLGDVPAIASRMSWSPVDGEPVHVSLRHLTLTTSSDLDAVARFRDGAVYARSMSALASARQLEAAQAFSDGDSALARQIVLDNMADLEEAEQAAPAAEAGALEQQRADYSASRDTFAAPPSSPTARAAAKRITEKDNANLGRQTY